MTIWYILWPFGLFFPFWNVGSPEKADFSAIQSL
jgi:hypothetical protein